MSLFNQLLTRWVFRTLTSTMSRSAKRAKVADTCSTGHRNFNATTTGATFEQVKRNMATDSSRQREVEMSNFRAPDVIAKKRDGQALSKEEIQYFVKGVVSKEFQDSQIGAMLMAIFLNGMNRDETITLTRAMRDSGSTLSFPAEWAGLIVDKHSTGGVGDKISLPLAPALAACGLKVPMISGRGLGHTGGTLDKLESIPNFTVDCTTGEMGDILEKVGCCIVGQTADIVPADRIMYGIRDVTGTVASLPLITASIVSKKASEGLSALVLDVKYGKAAFMETLDKARDLAQSMVSASEGLGMKTVALLTRMDNPIGLTIGNGLEVWESLLCLQGEGPQDLKELVCQLGGHLLARVGTAATASEGAEKIAEKLSNGEALQKFCDMMVAQGVKQETAEALCCPDTDIFTILPRAQHVQDLCCQTSGFIQSIDALELARVSAELGAGRSKAGEAVDPAVGLQLLKTVGSKVTKGDVWVKVHHQGDCVSANHITRLQKSLLIGGESVEVGSRVAEVIP
ncbi:PREDICTED: thymidine phosphorylase-like [Branchiostoma belcheri]|uniref:Thymidine phosphorylase n=1 Tax=Branchiostoma belcheri TaxID=7741 RepID=A0A6P4XUP8_BRABE|nr:PREDICTED: thymidine phosphorylase-like [Branchiostoma belcheri]